VIERHLLRAFEDIIPDELTAEQLQHLVKLDRETMTKLSETKARLDTITKALGILGDIY
jgi:hypothetical protein